MERRIRQDFTINLFNTKMNLKIFVIDFLITFAVAFIVTAAVTFSYSLIIHGEGIIGWETAFQLSIILGIIFSLLNRRNNKQ